LISSLLAVPCKRRKYLPVRTKENSYAKMIASANFVHSILILSFLYMNLPDACVPNRTRGRTASRLHGTPLGSESVVRVTFYLSLSQITDVNGPQKDVEG
jgi:hypothetical protein